MTDLCFWICIMDLWCSIHIHFRIYSPCWMFSRGLANCVWICYTLFWMKLNVYIAKLSWEKPSTPNCMYDTEAMSLINLHACGGCKRRIDFILHGMKVNMLKCTGAFDLGLDHRISSCCVCPIVDSKPNCG